MIRHTIILVIAVLLLNSSSLTAQTVDLVVDQSQSSLSVTILGQTETSSLTGNGVIELIPLVEPFSTARLTELNLNLADGFSFSFLLGIVSVSAEPGAVNAFIATPGPAGTVDMNNQFDQLNNEAGLSGVVSVVDPVGLIGGTNTIILEDANIDLFFDITGVI